MPLNEKHVFEIVLEQCNQVEERYEGYRKSLVDCIADILLLERQHSVSHIDIRVKVQDACVAAGRLLEQNTAHEGGRSSKS